MQQSMHRHHNATTDSGLEQLDDYITLLPAPLPPQNWVLMCRQSEQKGVDALASWLLHDSCTLPDVQGSKAASCQLGRQPWAYRFRQPTLAAFTAALFHSIVAGRAAAARQLGAPAPQLSRFDLFHGHVFVVPDDSTNQTHKGQQLRGRRLKLRQPCSAAHTVPGRSVAGGSASASSNSTFNGVATKGNLALQPPRVGILFHAAEYPAFDSEVFPIFLGHCQRNSTISWQQRAMDLRNILWYQGKLAVLDVGVHSPLHGLLHEGTQPLRTVYESDFGQPVADVLLLKEPHRRRRNLKVAERLQQQRWHRLMKAGRALAACSKETSDVYVSY